MIVGGVKIYQPGTDKNCWRYNWQGKDHKISGMERITGISRSNIYRCVRGRAPCYVGHLSCGTLLPMLTWHFAKKHAPEGLPAKLLTKRLQQKQCLDLPITEKEQERMNFQKSVGYIVGESICETKKRLENMRVHRLFATMPRPDGMNSETKEWVKPAW